MKQVVRTWLAGKKVQAVLGHYRCEGLITYEHFIYLDKAGKYHKFEVMYTPWKILGRLQDQEVLALEGPSEKSDRPVIVSEVLDTLVVSYDSLEELNKNRPKEITTKAMESLINKYVGGTMQGLYSSATEHFKVIAVEFINNLTPLLIVRYSALGEELMPITLNLGEPSLVKRYNFGKLKAEFVTFVEKLGAVTGGIVWYEE